MAEEHGQVVEEELDPEREARRRVALARIRQYPDPVLRMEAKKVTKFDDDLRSLVQRMTYLMVEARGLGLAANQVGALRRVFVCRLGEDEEDEEVEPTAIVNPVIVARGDETATDDEGCLSLQGVLVPVERHLNVTLEGQDAEGTPLHLELEGVDARVAQHELDHLDAVLIVDRTTKEARREAMATLRAQPVLG